MAADGHNGIRTETASKLFFGASLFILGLAVGMIGWRSDSGLSNSPALAQSFRSSGTGGIMAFAGQIEKDMYGIVMVDVDAGTMWLYQYRKGANQLKLLAARSWLYDRYLEDYNNAELKPSDVAQLVAQQQQKSQSETTTAPAESVEP